MKYEPGEGPENIREARELVRNVEAKRVHNVAGALDRDRTRNDALDDPKFQTGDDD